MTVEPADRGAALLAIARSALVEAVTGRAAAEAPREPAGLEERGATFVTLNRGGELRGCVGTLQPARPLSEDVRRNARAAALEDIRFAPVRAEELEEISLEVSVLSPLEEIEHRDEQHLLSLLRPGVDGVVIAYREHRSTFLPQVWNSLPTPAEFLGALKKKAGMARSFWADELRAWRFTVEKYAE